MVWCYGLEINGSSHNGQKFDIRCFLVCLLFRGFNKKKREFAITEEVDHWFIAQKCIIYFPFNDRKYPLIITNLLWQRKTTVICYFQTQQVFLAWTELTPMRSQKRENGRLRCAYYKMWTLTNWNFKRLFF